MGKSWVFRVAAVVCLPPVLAAGSVALAQTAPQYEVIDLTELVGAAEGEAYDVNDLGKVVMKLEIDGDTGGYVWSETDGLQILAADGWHHLQPRAINNNGTTTGLGSTKDPWGLPAFVRTPDGSVSQLNSKAAGSENSSYGYGLNEAGWAVGGGPASSSLAAFLWRPPGYTTGAVLSGTAYQAMARDANDRVRDDGQPAPVVVGSLRRSWEKYTSAVSGAVTATWRRSISASSTRPRLPTATPTASTIATTSSARAVRAGPAEPSCGHRPTR